MIPLAFVLPLAVASAQSISVKDFGAVGNGSTDDRESIQAAMDAACDAPQPRLYLPAGTYTIAGELRARCSMTIAGDGPAKSIIVETDQSRGRRALATDWQLTVEDLGFRTPPLTGVDKGMAAIARGYGRPGAAGQRFVFERVHIHGFNFGIAVSGGIGAEAESVTVRDAVIEVFTAPNAVGSAINLGNLRQAIVEDSTLAGDGNNDHAIYLLSVRDAAIRRNRIRNIGNSAIKILTANYGRGAQCPEGRGDYRAWRIEGNRIEDSVMALALYSYCDIVLPRVSIVNNRIRNMTDRYAGSYAAAIVQATCRSVMEMVESAGNEFENIGLGGIVLLSTVQNPNDGCGDPRAKGAIREFRSERDRFERYSTAYPGRFPAINSSGSNFGHASLIGLRARHNLSEFASIRIAGR